MNDRAISELIGFVLIFSIIVTGATLALTVGESGLDEIRTFEQQENAERAFVLLGQNFAELEHSRSESVSGTIDLNDGQVWYENESSVDVTVENATGETREFTLPMGSVVYEVDGATVRYESGLVVRADGDNGVEKSAPRFSCRDGGSFLSVVTLNGDDASQFGSGTVQISARSSGSSLAYPHNRSGPWDATDAAAVTIDVDSPRAAVWERHLDENGWSETATDGEYECGTTGSDSVYVRQTTANVSFGR